MKSSKGIGLSGTPSSDQDVNWKCCTSLGSLLLLSWNKILFMFHNLLSESVLFVHKNWTRSNVKLIERLLCSQPPQLLPRFAGAILGGGVVDRHLWIRACDVNKSKEALNTFTYIENTESSDGVVGQLDWVQDGYVYLSVGLSALVRPILMASYLSNPL